MTHGREVLSKRLGGGAVIRANKTREPARGGGGGRLDFQGTHQVTEGEFQNNDALPLFSIPHHPKSSVTSASSTVLVQIVCVCVCVHTHAPLKESYVSYSSRGNTRQTAREVKAKDLRKLGLAEATGCPRRPILPSSRAHAASSGLPCT